MAKKSKKRSEIGFRIMGIDKDGNVICIHDASNASGRRDNPYHNEEAAERLRKKVVESFSQKACEIYTNDPSVFAGI